MKYFSFIRILFFSLVITGYSSSVVNSQVLHIDSLFQQLDNEQNDSVKIALYKKIGKFLYKSGKSDSAYFYLKKGIQNKGVNIHEKADCYFYAAEILNKRKKYPESLRFYLKANDLFIQIDNFEKLALSNERIAQIYYKFESVENALKYLKISVKYAEKTGNKQNTAKAYNNLGILFRIKKDYQNAVSNYKKSISLKEALNDSVGLSKTYNNIGTVYLKMFDYEKAEEYLLKSLYLKRQLKDSLGICISYVNLSGLYIALGDSEENKNVKFKYYKTAVKYAEDAYNEAVKSDNLESIYNSTFFASEAYENIGNYKQALKFRKLYSDIQDSMFDAEKLKAIQRVETDAEAEKLMQENVLLSEKQKLTEEKLAESQARKLYFTVASLLLLILIVYVFITNRKIRKTNKDLRLLNHKIKEQDKILKASEEKYKTLFENTDDPTLIIKDGVFIDCNYATVRMLEYKTKEDIIGKSPRDLSPEYQPDGQKSEKKARKMMNVVLKKGVNRFEWVHVKKGGEEFIADVLLTSIPYKDYKIIHTVWRDITEYKQNELNLIKAKEEAENANKLKSEFLANMSNEIRTPMNAIIGFSDVLFERLEDTELRSFVEKVKDSGDNLLRLIEDILDISKIEAGHIEILNHFADIRKTASEIIKIFSDKSKNKGIDFNVSVAENLPKSIFIDDFRLKQILTNLIDNAVKFTEKGSVSVLIFCENTLNKETDLVLKVKDTGIGIAFEESELIFENFRQSENRTAGKYCGTGLGLAISKHLAELMNGEITLKSELGIGSEFTVVFKGVRISNDEKFNVDSGKPGNYDLQKLNVLLAEDNLINRQLILALLENQKFHITEALNGKEVLDILEHEIPDLILMDIQMPVLDGYEATKIIKKDERFKHIPVIALTAHAIKDVVAKYHTIFDDYLTKPVSRDDILKSISAFILKD